MCVPWVLKLYVRGGKCQGEAKSTTSSRSPKREDSRLGTPDFAVGVAVRLQLHSSFNPWPNG